MFLPPLVFLLGVAAHPLPTPPDTGGAVRVAVLSVDLNNLHNAPPDTALAGRIERLGAALRARIESACGYAVVPIPAETEAAALVSSQYFYDHPDVAVALAAGAGADWVVVPRLNRASPWVTDLQAHLVRVSDGVIVNNRIVEIKGIELDPDLAARLIERGSAWMADQLSQALELARRPGEPVRRLCPP